MGTCNRCRYWLVDNPWARGEEQSSITECGLVDYAQEDDPIGDKEFAVYSVGSDVSGVESGLKTGPLFGCVLFEPKQDQENLIPEDQDYRTTSALER